MSLFIALEDMPPSMQAQALAIREEMLSRFAQQEQQRIQSEAQQEELRRTMALKMKRRIRKAQKRGR